MRRRCLGRLLLPLADFSLLPEAGGPEFCVCRFLGLWCVSTKTLRALGRPRGDRTLTTE